MNRFSVSVSPLLSLAGACLTLFTGPALVPVYAQAQVQGWHTDLTQAARAARQADKPILVVFRCVR